MSTLFISHSSQDNEIAQKVQKKLAAQHHYSVFLDFDPDKGIKAGQSWEQTLYRKLRACQAVIIICTKSYIKSKWCFAELALARMEGKLIFALIFDPKVKTSKLPPILTDTQIINMTDDMQIGYSRLWKGLEEEQLLGLEGDWDPDRPPYLGLASYEEKDARVFFGRQEESRTGQELLTRGSPNMIMVLGASGSGKSSLVKAGIIPRLRKYPDKWIIVDPFRPGRDPFREMALSLEKVFHATVESENIGKFSNEQIRKDLIEGSKMLTSTDVKHVSDDASFAIPSSHLRSEESSLNKIAWKLRSLSKNQRNAKVLIVIDQFEELLGHEREDDIHNLFLALIHKSLDEDNGHIKVLSSMRSDYLNIFQGNPALRNIDFESLSLGPMPIERIKEVIEKPAKLGAITLEDGLSDRLLHDTKTSDALPLLSFTLWKLWKDYSADGTLRIRDYEVLGGLHGAIAKEAEIVLALGRRLGKEDTLRKVFIKMARLSEDEGYDRQPISHEDPDLAEVKNIIEKFIDSRLLFSYAQDDKMFVEVAHESLFRSWHELKSWLDNNRSELLFKQQLHRDAKAWMAEGRSNDLLWTGSRLQKAHELYGDNGIGKDESDFVDRGMKKKTRRQRIIMAIASATIVVLSALSIFAFIALSNLKKANSNTIDLLLREIDRDILQLDYTSALEKAKATLELGKTRPEAVQFLQEIAYFYNEIEYFAEADSILREIGVVAMRLDSAEIRKQIRNINPLHFSFLEKRYYPEMILVPKGEFIMGEGGKDEDEKPARMVEIGSYFIAKKETTGWQYNLFIKATNREELNWSGTGLKPAGFISWYDALYYFNWLSERRGYEKVYDIDRKMQDPNDLDSVVVDWQQMANWEANGFRLPTEAEWEYAARGGSEEKEEYIYSGSDSLDQVGWYIENSESQKHPVGSKNANHLGIFDMTGNSWEWCWDWYRSDYYSILSTHSPKGSEQGTHRVLRGCARNNNHHSCRIANRGYVLPVYRVDFYGIRCVRGI